MPPTLSVCQYYGRTDAYHGGVARAVVDAAVILTRRGHRVTVLAGRMPDMLADHPDRGALEIVELPRRLPGRLLRRSDLKRATEILGRSDVIHIHEVWDPAALQLAGRARRLGLAVVVSAHGSLGAQAMRSKRLKKRLFLWLGGRRMLERASAVHCLTEHEARQSRRWCPRARFRVVPLAMDLSGYAADPGPDATRHLVEGFDPTRPNLVFMGRIDPRKGPDRLIDAVIRLHREGLDCNVVIAGRGAPDYVAALGERATAGGVAALIRFPGFVSGLAKVALLHWADLFVLPTHHEVWGIALHEALAAGTPVVTTEQVEIRDDLVATGGAVIVPADPGALAQAIRALVGDRAALTARGAAASERILESHRPDRVGDEYTRLYRDLGAAHRIAGSNRA
jgi:glycosyltransferase involved in cell wall biosynthesis